MSRQLAMMDRSQAQLEEAMRRREISESVIAQIIEQFAAMGLIDDERFAQLLVRTRFSERGRSRRAISEELARKGVAADVAAEALSSISPEEELAAAVHLAEKKLRISTGDPDTIYRRTYAYLARRGFTPGQCNAAISRARTSTKESDFGESTTPFLSE